MKKITAFLIILILSICQLAAAPLFQLKVSYQYSYDTNAFSDPLPMNGDSSWLANKIANPYLKRHNNGLLLEFTYYPAEGSRTGLSATFRTASAFKATQIAPDSADSSTAWEYIETDVTADQNNSYFFGLGAIFKASFFDSRLDFGAALRFALGTYDSSQKDVILAIQTDAYLDYHVHRNFFFTLGIDLQSNMFKFTNYNEQYYEENYFMISLAPYVGAGIRFR